jgi:hypothetical protein
MNVGTKQMMKWTLLVAAMYLLSGCGGKGGGSAVSANFVPQCAGDAQDSSSAVSVPAGTVVKATEPDTQIRVWHYSNSDKKVCVIQGKAVIE